MQSGLIQQQQQATAYAMPQGISWMHLQANGVLGVQEIRCRMQSVNIWYAFHPAVPITHAAILTSLLAMQNLELYHCQ